MDLSNEKQVKPTNDKVQEHETIENKTVTDLKGNNKRLESTQATNSEGTAAWANEETKYDVSNVSIPSEEDVERAKNWIDNGNKL